VSSGRKKLVDVSDGKSVGSTERIGKKGLERGRRLGEPPLLQPGKNDIAEGAAEGRCTLQGKGLLRNRAAAAQATTSAQ